MARPKLELEKKSNGSFSTAGLNSQQFNQAFDLIQKKNTANRRKASHTITPTMLKRKGKADLAKLGRKQNGQPFTKQDLIDLEKSKKEFERKYNRDTAGITFLELMSGSRDIDVKRANNQVNDGSGITSGNLVIIKGGTLTFNVRASMKNGKDNHRVIIRLEEWDNYMSEATPTKKGYQKATGEAAKGRMSIQCSCERHQYWYRYLATIGNYCVAPPKENSPPKIRNPTHSGVACKHVLFIANKMVSPSWTNQLAIYMTKQANKIGYGDDRTRHVLSKDEQKAQNKTRKGNINQKALQKEFERYQKRQQNMAKNQEKNKERYDKLRKQLKKKENQFNKKIETQRKAHEKALENERREKGDLIRSFYPMFKDSSRKNGWSESVMKREFSKKMNIPLDVIEKVLK
ncbi:hypothetical protein [Aliivibrio salmonicida]|uniref:hypothetical protein n=1 Tax=Aliivibrio salmonicida TaxID=40269 RepID=UPI003D101FFD